jgi:hypothetical protein
MNIREYDSDTGDPDHLEPLRSELFSRTSISPNGIPCRSQSSLNGVSRQIALGLGIEELIYKRP